MPLMVARNAREQRLILAVSGAPALEQIHLHEMHGVDIGIAQRDRALQASDRCRAAAPRRAAQHVPHRQRVFAADGLRMRARGSRPPGHRSARRCRDPCAPASLRHRRANARKTAMRPACRSNTSSPCSRDAPPRCRCRTRTSPATCGGSASRRTPRVSARNGIDAVARSRAPRAASRCACARSHRAASRRGNIRRIARCRRPGRDRHRGCSRRWCCMAVSEAPGPAASLARRAPSPARPRRRCAPACASRWAAARSFD